MEPTSDCQVTLGAGSLAMVGKEKMAAWQDCIYIYLFTARSLGFFLTFFYWVNMRKKNTEELTSQWLWRQE
jgi:hypothetical protein